ncbi:hypothetical protein WR25_15479 [Diploscapter pachys]|uniref:rRNA methyltransferase 1, mitochondrial n=1 Tax=Diploscapter pachys TaxID=2018661 RepID=A0A2A2J3Y0_9BILA|nr:hypothetical protein WR25_15479 [Diploscapter pachys]
MRFTRLLLCAVAEPELSRAGGTTQLFNIAKKTKQSPEKVRHITNKVKVPKFKGEAIYGIYPVLEALRAGRRHFYSLHIKNSVKERKEENTAIKELLELAGQKHVHIYPAEAVQLDKLTQFQLHNGVCADVDPLKYAMLEDFASTSVFLDGVLDPGNIGAIARCAYFFGADHLVYCHDKGPERITPSMLRASAGAIEHLKIGRVKTIENYVKFVKYNNAQIVITCDSESAQRRPNKIDDIPLHEWKPTEKTALILGDEGQGVSEELVEQCDVAVSIPNLARKKTSINSINVSVVAGIVLHHIYAQKALQKQNKSD